MQVVALENMEDMIKYAYEFRRKKGRKRVRDARDDQAPDDGRERP
jgi:hypothetical protein